MFRGGHNNAVAAAAMATCCTWERKSEAPAGQATLRKSGE